MSEENGYATESELVERFTKTQYKDAVIMGQRFQLRSISAERLQEWLDENENDPDTANERIIVMAVSKPELSMESVAKLRKMHAGFVIELANACAKHVGVQTIEQAEKN